MQILCGIESSVTGMINLMKKDRSNNFIPFSFELEDDHLQIVTKQLDFIKPTHIYMESKNFENISCTIFFICFYFIFNVIFETSFELVAPLL